MQILRPLLLVATLLRAGFASAQAAPPPQVNVIPDERLLSSEVSAGVGLQGAGYAFGGGRWGDLFLTPVVDGRLLLGGFTLEGDLLVSVPTAGNGAGAGGTFTLRAGYTGQRFTLVAGPSVQYTPSAQKTAQLLPSLYTRVSWGGWGLSLGLFDLHALTPAHLSLELGDFGAGLALLGVEAHARFRLSHSLGIKVQALVMTLLNTQQALVTVSAVYGGKEGFR